MNTMKRIRKYFYATSCVECSTKDVPALHAMIDESKEVTLVAIRRHCYGLREWEKSMGYATGGERGLHLKNDYHVSYHKSTFRGRRCYYIVHSAIEYIWTENREAQ